MWLRDHVRAQFAMAASPDFGGVTCDGNVCCFPGMEYMSSHGLVVRRVTLGDQPGWALDAAYEVAQAALGEEYIARNRRYVASALQRLANGRCRGEPPGFH